MLAVDCASGEMVIGEQRLSLTLVSRDATDAEDGTSAGAITAPEQEAEEFAATIEGNSEMSSSLTEKVDIDK